jgi:hypothetical protein
LHQQKAFSFKINTTARIFSKIMNTHQEKAYLLIQKIKLEYAEICHNLLEQAANMWPKLNQLNQLELRFPKIGD